MTRDVKLYIKRLQSPDAYVLVNENGEMLPFQMDCCLRSSPPDGSTFTVTFLAGKRGLQVVDERDDD